MRFTQDVDIVLRRSDMLGTGLINANWPARYPPALAARLQHLIDTPDG